MITSGSTKLTLNGVLLYLSIPTGGYPFMMTISSRRMLVSIIMLRTGWPVQLPGNYDVQHGSYIACLNLRTALIRKSAVFFSMPSLTTYSQTKTPFGKYTHRNLASRKCIQTIQYRTYTPNILWQPLDAASVALLAFCSFSARHVPQFLLYNTCLFISRTASIASMHIS